MKHEKILKREDGSRVKICVSIHTKDYGVSNAEFRSFVLTCKKGKRTWCSTYDSNDYRFRALPMHEREKFAENSQFNSVTKEELKDVKLELWNMIKPC